VTLAVVGSAVIAGVGSQPAVADVTTVTGSACAYFANVSLFGGPAMRRGCGQPADAPANNLAPAVVLPPSGGSPVVADDADGAFAQYGPAFLFSGQYPNAANDPTGNAPAPPSGPLHVSTQGTTGPNGAVMSTASVAPGTQGTADPNQPRGVGPGPIIADAVSSTCAATETNPATGAKSVTGSTTITNGTLVLTTDANGAPATSEPVPATPPANYTRTGTITNVGDNFKVVYNEQTTDGNGVLTVNAVHMTLLGPTAVGDLVIGQSVCGIATVAGTTTTTLVGTTTTTGAGTTTTTVAATTTTTAPAATTTTAGGGATTTSTAPAASGDVSGGACGYFSEVSLFGGPRNRRGCDQPADAPASNASPSVTLPAGGSASPVSATDTDGATAQYGPAKLFSGQYPSNDPNADAPPSGPITVSTQGTPGGSVTSTASISLPRGVGPGPIVADGVRSTCTAGASGLTASTTITNGTLVTSTTADGSALDTQPVPVNPPVNYTRTGTITNVGDNFRVVYNEQTQSGGSITVNAVHMYLLGPTAVGDLVIAQSRCGRTAGGTITATGTGGVTAGGGGRVASTGTNVVRTVAVALLLVAAGAHVRHLAPQLEWMEPTAGGGFRRRRWPRRAGRPRRPSTKRLWN